MNTPDPNRPVGEEARKAHPRRLQDGFIAAYLSGQAILDIGYKGYRDDVVPIVPAAIGVDLDYPGYDGATLPFADESQDAVFSSHCLEHIEDFQNAIRDWFRVLKHGGYLVIIVPHQFLYEKQTELPSRYNSDHKRFYTPASLMAEIEMSLKPNTYRLRRLNDNDTLYDYAIPPDRHATGSYEVEAVIEKIPAPSWYLVKPPVQAGRKVGVRAQPGSAAPRDRTEMARENSPLATRTIQTAADPALVYAFGPTLPVAPRILVLKLDHLGDFIIGRPALQRLRDMFPQAHISLVVGAWNQVAAESSGLCDAVLIYHYFPQHALGWDGKPHDRIEKFHSLTARGYDIAIDLRVDEDTRWLLAEVEARLRCGIGSRKRHPFLDVVLPPENVAREAPSETEAANAFIKPSRFGSAMPFRHSFYHETDFRPVSGHMIYGPFVTLPRGHFTVKFDLRLTGWQLNLGKTRITLDVSRNGQEIGVHKRLRGRDLRKMADGSATLSFENDDLDARHEFRVHVVGRPWRTRLRFGGVVLEHGDTAEPARFRQSELHIGEQLSLLIQLVIDRTRNPYRDARPSAPPRAAVPAMGRFQIAMAPFSNSNLRDWPFVHYVRLIGMLLDGLDCSITLLGARQQAEALDHMVLEAAGGARVRSLAGQTAWVDMPALLGQFDLVICNNSGIAHLAASVGALTLAIYSASHQPQNWGPRGPRSHAVMSVVPCSPCGYDRLEECPHQHRCMVGLMPETIYTEAASLLSTELKMSLTLP